jgi:hypothetical protein
MPRACLIQCSLWEGEAKEGTCSVSIHRIFNQNSRSEVPFYRSAGPKYFVLMKRTYYRDTALLLGPTILCHKLKLYMVSLV